MTTGLPAFHGDDLPAHPGSTGTPQYFGRVAFCLLFSVILANSAFGQSIERKLFELDPQTIDFANPDVIPNDMQRWDGGSRRTAQSSEDYWEANITFLGIKSTFMLKRSKHAGKNYYFVSFDELDDCRTFSRNLIALYGEPYRSYLPEIGDSRHYEIGWRTHFGRMAFDCQEIYHFDARVLTLANLSSGPISEIKEVAQRIKIRCEGIVEAVGSSEPYLRHVTLSYVIDDDDKELLSDIGGPLGGNIAKFDSEGIVLLWIAKSRNSRFEVKIDRLTGNYRYVALYKGEKARELGAEKFVVNGFCKTVGIQ